MRWENFLFRFTYPCCSIPIPFLSDFLGIMDVPDANFKLDYLTYSTIHFTFSFEGAERYPMQFSFDFDQGMTMLSVSGLWIMLLHCICSIIAWSLSLSRESLPRHRSHISMGALVFIIQIGSSMSPIHTVFTVGHSSI